MSAYREEALPTKLRSLRQRLAEVNTEIEATERLLEALTAPPRREPRARGPWALAAVVALTLGVTLLVCCDPCMFGSAGCCGGSRYDTTLTRAATLRSAATLYRSLYGSERCPTVSDLFDTGFLHSGTETVDGWDNSMRIVCIGDDVFPVSERFDGENIIDEAP